MTPSLRNWGIAKMTYDDSTGLDLLSVDVIHTSIDKESKKSKALQDLEACNTLIEGINKHLEGIDLIVIELPIGSQSSSNRATYMETCKV